MSKIDSQNLCNLSLAEAREKAGECLNCKNPMCKKGCPAGNNIPEFISQVKAGNIEGAYELILQKSMMPEICSKICQHEKQCEGYCVRGIKGTPVAISALESFVANFMRGSSSNSELASVLAPVHSQSAVPTSVEKITLNGPKIAVVGAGPAGLSCAYYLTVHGYQVTVFEKDSKAGGVLTYGIPEFRLSKKEYVVPMVNKLKKMGIKFEYNKVLGKDFTVASLKKEGFKAVFIGIGASESRRLNIEGEGAEGVYLANDFLRKSIELGLKEFKLQQFQKPNMKAVVVGGGNVAIDAARTAKRLGLSTTIVYRRGKDEMPAYSDELRACEDEGVEFRFLTNPTKILTENNRVVGVECIEMELGEVDSTGRRKPVAKLDSAFSLQCDIVIEAIGSFINTNLLKKFVNEKGVIVVDPSTMQTMYPNVYAGGDVVSGPATVVQAVQNGRVAAESISKENLP